MTPERWERIKAIFDEAVALPREDREPNVRCACGEDEELAKEVIQLLSNDESATHFLSTPLIDPEILRGHGFPLLVPGKLLAGRFRIERRVGSGGMGEVYEANDEVLGTRVALKTVRPELARIERVLAQFRTEVQLSREVTHPNVCRIHDLFVVQEPELQSVPVAFLTMEFVSGETLAERIGREGPLAVELAIPILRCIAEALDAAHKAQVVHRDLKTSNVMLTTDGSGAVRAVVMDFGIASAAGCSGSPFQKAGTPLYMSPEQRRGEPPTPRADIYSLGIIAHEILTGTLPARTPADSDAANSLSKSLPSRWKRALSRCLDPEPAHRYASAREFADALSPRWTTRRQILVAALVAGPAAGVYAAASIMESRQAARRPKLAVIPFMPVTPDPELAAIGEALAGDVTRALSRSAQFFVVGEESSRLASAGLGLGSVSTRLSPDGEEASRRFAVEAAQRLRVPYVLVGSVSRSMPYIALRATLRSGVSGAVLWGQVFTEESGRLPSFRNRIAQSAPAAIDSTLATWATNAFVKPQTGNAEAYHLYLLGRSSAARRNVKSLEESIGYLEAALRLDQNFSDAHAAKAAAQSILAGRPNYPIESTFSAAREGCRRALAIDPASAEAHIVLGSVCQRFDWNWNTADAEFRAALSSSPGLAAAHHWYSGLLSIRRLQDDAVFEAARARELDPLSLPVNTAYGVMLYRSRRYDDALRQLEFTLQLASGHQPALVALACVLAARGDHEGALRLQQQNATSAGTDPWAQSWLATGLAGVGRRADAAAIGAELERRWAAEQFSPMTLAHIRKALGDIDGTFRWLEVAVGKRDPSVTILRADPAYDALRHDPRFERIATALNL